MKDNWLYEYLREASARSWCVKVHCTTCGALEFRRGVFHAFGRATGQPVVWPPNRDSSLGIIRALAQIIPTEADGARLQPAVRCLLYDAWVGIPCLDREVESLLSDTWGGRVLRSMQEHHAVEETARRAREQREAPAEVRRRRDEKRRLKQEQHERRLVAKRDRDRLWHRAHDIPGSHNSMRSYAASVFHAVMQLDPETIFDGNLASLAKNQLEDARVPAPGWVGRDYKAGGVVFFAINPGGGTESYVQPRRDDRELYGLLRRFQEASTADNIERAFDELCEAWIKIQSAHHNIRRPIGYVLEALDVPIHQTAFLDLVPFRTANDKSPPVSVVRRSWEQASSRQLAALRPGRIVMLGRKVASAFERLGGAARGMGVDVYKRSRGDNSVSPEARALLDRLRGQRSERPPCGASTDIRLPDGACIDD